MEQDAIWMQLGTHLAKHGRKMIRWPNELPFPCRLTNNNNDRGIYSMDLNKLKIFEGALKSHTSGPKIIAVDNVAEILGENEPHEPRHTLKHTTDIASGRAAVFLRELHGEVGEMKCSPRLTKPSARALPCSAPLATTSGRSRDGNLQCCTLDMQHAMLTRCTAKLLAFSEENLI